MGGPTKPTNYLNWTDGNPTKVTQPPSAQALSGWTPGEPPPPDYMNWLLYTADQWIQYLDQSANSEVSIFNNATNIRLIGGGAWSWKLSTSTLSWSSAFNISTPSLADSDNQASAGSIVMNDGDIAYVQANIPFTTTGAIVSGQNTITDLAYEDGISAGDTVTGTGIPSSTTVVSISGNTAVMSSNATATNASATLTFTGTGALTVSDSPVASLVTGPTTVVIARRVGNSIILGVNSGQAILKDGETKPLLANGYLTWFTAPAGENLTQGQIAYLSPGSSDGRTAGSAYRCDASNLTGVSRWVASGVVITTTTSGGTVTLVNSGMVNLFTGLTPGQPYYADPATLGGVTSTYPSTSGYYGVPVGIAISAAEIALSGFGDGVIIQGVSVPEILTVSPSVTPVFVVPAAINGGVIEVHTQQGPVSLIFPPPSSNARFLIKDIDGFASQNPITVAITATLGAGDNSFGELGNGQTASPPQSSPVVVLGGLTLVSGSSTTEAAGGVDVSGNLYTWGSGSAGVPSMGQPASLTPKLLFTNVTKFMTSLVSSALLSNGLIYTFGNNINGSQGNGTPFTNNSSPTLIVGGFTGFTDIATAQLQMLGLNPTGIYGWGNNESGQIGPTGISPTSGISTPTLIVTTQTFKSVYTGYSNIGSTFYGFSAGIDSAGNAYCWGRNVQGLLGINATPAATAAVSSPTLVVGGLNFEKLSIGQSSIVGLTTSGHIYAWGDNSLYQCGVPGQGAYSSPVLVSNLVFSDIACFNGGCFGIQSNGTIYGWGTGTFGTFGNNSLSNLSSPTLIAAAGTYRGVFSGHTSFSAFFIAGLNLFDFNGLESAYSFYSNFGAFNVYTDGTNYWKG